MQTEITTLKQDVSTNEAIAAADKELTQAKKDDWKIRHIHYTGDTTEPTATWRYIILERTTWEQISQEALEYQFKEQQS